MYRSEQKDLAKEIDRAWQSFRIWVEETNFEGTICNVTLSMQHDLRFTDDDDTSPGKSHVAEVAIVFEIQGSCDSLRSQKSSPLALRKPNQFRRYRNSSRHGDRAPRPIL
jgi:hypothetical protein